MAGGHGRLRSEVSSYDTAPGRTGISQRAVQGARADRWPGEFVPIMQSVRGDWGNVTQKGFMDAVASWQTCILAATGDAQASTKGRTGAKHDLKTEINQRHKTEAALHRSESHYAHLLEQSRHMEEQLRDLSRQLLVSQEEERRRISRELHDEIIQTLVGINVHLASLSPDLPLNRQNFQKKIARTQKLVEKSVAIIHNFARELRPTVLDDLGLVAALRSFVRDFTNRTHIKVHFRACPQTDDLSGMKRTVLYRVAQSAMTNVHKHADATHVDLTISKIENALRMEIQDNGKSFDVARVLLAKRHKRLGLLGSRERIEMVGGIFTVNSNGGGTVVRADVPL